MRSGSSRAVMWPRPCSTTWRLSGISLITVAGAVPVSHRLPDYPFVSPGENGTLKPRDYKEGTVGGQPVTGRAVAWCRVGMLVALRLADEYLADDEIGENTHQRGNKSYLQGDAKSGNSAAAFHQSTGLALFHRRSPRQPFQKLAANPTKIATCLQGFFGNFFIRFFYSRRSRQSSRKVPPPNGSGFQDRA